jgi:aryl-alcohol dehydrogenase-like predicted oxidoreductase
MIEYRALGVTGVKVSSLALGTMMLGSWGNQSLEESIRIIHAALDSGINIIDTADIYGAGESEEIVGRALSERKRSNVILATKFHAPMSDSPNWSGNSRRWMFRAVEDSLRRLKTDWIDLYQVHRPDPDTAMDETLAGLSDLIQAGKVRYIGTSTFPPSEIVEAQWLARVRRYSHFACEQPPYSILARGVEAEVLPVCQRYGLGVITWGPLAGGWLSGRRQSPQEAASPRVTLQPARFDLSVVANQRKRDAVDALLRLSANIGVSLLHLALAFVRAHPAVTSAILGPRTIGQLMEQLSGDFEIDSDVLDEIDAIVPPGTDLTVDDRDWLPPSRTDSSGRRRCGTERFTRRHPALI